MDREIIEMSNFASNIPKESPPVLNKEKRVIKNMIVMDRQKLKEFGMDGILENAMSKLEKDTPEKSMSKPTRIHPSKVPSKAPSKLVAPAMKNICNKSLQPDLPSATPTSEVNKPILLKSTSVSAEPSTSFTKRVVQQSFALSSTTPPITHLVKSTIIPAVSIENYVDQPIIITSIPNVIKKEELNPTPNSVKLSIDASSTNKQLQMVPHFITDYTAKSDGVVNRAPSDGKKIKILSDVSLNETTKAKLLQIDKISHKDLKFTNVIKGTHNSSKSSNQKSDLTTNLPIPLNATISATQQTVKSPIFKTTSTRNLPILLSSPSSIDSSLCISMPSPRLVKSTLSVSLSPSSKIVLPQKLPSNITDDDHIEITVGKDKQTPIQSSVSLTTSIQGIKSPIHLSDSSLSVSMSPPPKIVLPGKFPSLGTGIDHIAITVAKHRQPLPKRKRTVKSELTPIGDATKVLQDAAWAAKNPRTYNRSDIKQLLNAKIMKKNRLEEEAVSQNVLSDYNNEPTTIVIDNKCGKQCLATCEFTGKQNIVDVTIQTTPKLQIVSESSATNVFYGFSVNEVHQNKAALDKIKATVSKHLANRERLNETLMDAADVLNSQQINDKTGVLAEHICSKEDDNVEVQIATSMKVEELIVTNIIPHQLQTVLTSPVKEPKQAHTSIMSTNSCKNLTEDRVQSSPSADISPISKGLTTDADDEISDIDLGHRMDFNPTSTTDDESELVSNRPPRPKLKKPRHRRTVEQLTIQHNSHVRLLKQFNQGQSVSDVWNDKELEFLIDGIDDRIQAPASQVMCCFDKHRSNAKSKFLSEECSKNVASVAINNNQSVKSNEYCAVDVTNASLNSVSVCESQLSQCRFLQLPEKKPHADDGTVDCEDKSGIQKNTSLVTEYDSFSRNSAQPLIVPQANHDEPIQHRLNTIRIKDLIPKSKHSRQTLVQMLAKCIDADTLKSVILAHEQQKCRANSSDSESDSDVQNANVNKIFRTICTIDLCDDDDETLHEDVLQCINAQEVEESVNMKEEVSGSSITLRQKSDTRSVANKQDITNSLKFSNNQSLQLTIKTEELELSNKDVDTFSLTKGAFATKICTSTEATSNKNSDRTESNNRTDFGDLEHCVEVCNENLDLELSCPSDIAQHDYLLNPDANITQEGNWLKVKPFDQMSNYMVEKTKLIPDNEPEKILLKLKPFHQISENVKPMNENSLGTEAMQNNCNLVVDDNLRGKPVHEDQNVKESENNISVQMNASEKSNCELNSLISLEPPFCVKVSETKIKILNYLSAEQKADNKESVPIVQCPIQANGTLQLSCKRKAEKSIETVSVPETKSEPPPKKPISNYFESPKILMTKRTRKSKNYVDCETSSTDDNKPKQRQRSSNRQPLLKESRQTDKSKQIYDSKQIDESMQMYESMEMSDSIEMSDSMQISESMLITESESERDSNMESQRGVDVGEQSLSESSNVPKAETSQENVPAIKTPLKTGRGVKQQALAPINIGDQYICGNCKEEVLAKNWTKHFKGHYGLAWRADVDPPIDMENIQCMAQKIIYFMKKSKIRFLKCKKCNVEKKSAVGYLSHLEVCGLSKEEIKSKLVKCEYCPSVVRSCSVKSHENLCSGLKKILRKEKLESSTDTESVNKEDCYNDQGRLVRRSAQKALSSFKEIDKLPETKVEDYVQRTQKINPKQYRKWMKLLRDKDFIKCVRNDCSFTADNIPSMLIHFNECVLINGETFYCNRCNYGPNTRDIIEKHIKSDHALGAIEGIDNKEITDSGDDAEVGEETSESDGESGENENLEKDYEQSDYDDDSDRWNRKGSKKKRNKELATSEAHIDSLDRKVLSQHAMILKSFVSGTYFQPTVEWTQDFRDKHFSTDDLLPFATPNKFSILNSSFIDAYIPKVAISNRFIIKDVRKYNNKFGTTVISKSDQWKSLQRFEATKGNNSIAFFTGGPIVSMAWLPVPDDHLSQILAVCCRNDPNEHILMNNTKQMKCLIQIWNCNNLKNDQLGHAQPPHLLYSIAYDYGPVIQMEFCPSGGFTEDRLGLLAVSSYDGHVDVLALPKNFTCDNSKVDDLIFVIEPSLILWCDLEKPLGVLLTKLVWSQAKGHSKIAAGYANGLVAIWNIKNLKSPLICSKSNGITRLLPQELFFSAHKPISLLEFHHDEKDESRWLIVGSHDRKVRFYDTHNVSLEISTTSAHSRIVAGCWPMHWTTFLIGVDNAYSLKVSGISVKQPLDIGSRFTAFYTCIGSTCDISFNNYLNAYVFVSSYGDIFAGYLRQILSSFADSRRVRTILGYTDNVALDEIHQNSSDLDKSIVEDNDATFKNEPKPSTSSTWTCEREEPQPSTSSALVCERDEPQPLSSSALVCKRAIDISYPSTDGIVFCDFHNPIPAITSPSYSKGRAAPVNSINMVKVNRIIFNPNPNAYKLYALGYEAGFVRINQLLPD